MKKSPYLFQSVIKSSTCWGKLVDKYKLLFRQENNAIKLTNISDTVFVR